MFLLGKYIEIATYNLLRRKKRCAVVLIHLCLARLHQLHFQEEILLLLHGYNQLKQTEGTNFKLLFLIIAVKDLR